jgi:iron-sulfur cluster repair protein YtfE (RIC family)
VPDPIERLLEEHREIMARIAELRAAVRALETRGEAAVPEALPALANAARMMATRLLAHARKEDEALFPALESVFGGVAGPTAMMREEHRDIHAQADRFRRTLHELEQVEHPAIVAGGAELGALAAGGGAAADLRDAGRRVIDLLDLHFEKEERILFPMAREVLSPAAMAGVARAMDALERDEQPAGGRERT